MKLSEFSSTSPSSACRVSYLSKIRTVMPSSGREQSTSLSKTRSQGVYAKAYEATKGKQLGFKSGGQKKEKKRQPARLSLGEGPSESYQLPRKSIEVDVIWIPIATSDDQETKYIKTITVRNLLRQLKDNRVKLLVDLEDESYLNLVEDETGSEVGM